MPAIEVRALTKRFRVPVRGSGLAAALGSLIRRSYDVVEAIRQISMVLGNKSQLTWDIPTRDSFDVLREIYRVPRDAFRRTSTELIDLLDAGALLAKPVRTLSLGERLKCELIAAFLHHPRLVFLDEPTLGLDVTMQRRLREFIAERNADGVTVLLTSHYVADVQALCRRVARCRATTAPS